MSTSYWMSGKRNVFFNMVLHYNPINTSGGEIYPDSGKKNCVLQYGATFTIQKISQVKKTANLLHLQRSQLSDHASRYAVDQLKEATHHGPTPEPSLACTHL